MTNLENITELLALLDQYEETTEKIIALRNVLNGRLNYPTTTIIPHELLDKYWKIQDVLRSEFGR